MFLNSKHIKKNIKYKTLQSIRTLLRTIFKKTNNNNKSIKNYPLFNSPYTIIQPYAVKAVKIKNKNILNYTNIIILY